MSIKTAQSRWIDSICYETMQGECYYQMGMYPEALAHYTNALETIPGLSQLAVPGYLSGRSVPTSAGRSRPPGRSAVCRPRWASCPTPCSWGRATSTPRRQLTQGGVVEPPNLFPVEPQEIVRCTALAIRRRGELLGPLAAHDPLIDNIIATLQRRPGQPNHWSEAWLNLELGMALSAGGRTAAAVPILQKATLASGEFEHPLTAMAHLELGRLAMAAGDYTSAAAHFEEATYASYYFSDVNHLPDLGVMEEAFRYGALEPPVGQRQRHLPAAGRGRSLGQDQSLAVNSTRRC